MARLLASTRSQCLHLGMCRLRPYCGVTKFGNVFRRWARDGGSVSALAQDGQTALSGILVVGEDRSSGEMLESKVETRRRFGRFEAILGYSQREEQT
jgi:hypothetical protein